MIKAFFNDMRKEREKTRYHRRALPKELVNGCIRITFLNQQHMIEDGIVKMNEDSIERCDATKEFKNWCEENLSGYYFIWQYGNGRGNPNQHKAGVWKIDIDVMRPEDAMAVKLRWVR